VAGGAWIPVLHGAADDRPDEADTLVAAEAVAAALRRLGHDSDLVHLGLDLSAIGELARRSPAVVFNLVEALDGSDSLCHLAAAALEHYGLAYTGAGAQALGLTLDKPTAKRLMRAAGLPTPDWSPDGRGFAPGSRVIVKSATEHASRGMDAGSVVPAERATAEITAREAGHGGRFFAETFIDGREFNLSLLETADGVRVLPPAEIVFVDYPADRPRIVDYEAKWSEGSFASVNTPRRFDFPPSDAPLLAALAALARQAWALFGVAGYARVDFRVDGAGQPWLLEVNVNPCLTPDAGFVAAAARAGLDFDTLIGTIVETAGRAREPATQPEPAQCGAAAQAWGTSWRETVTREDAARIRALVAATGMFSAEEIDIAEELVLERLARGQVSGYEFVLAERDGRLVGYACHGPIPGSEVSHDLYWIAVHPDVQGQGLGRAIQRRAEAAIRRAGGRYLYADTSSSEVYAPTRAFYRRMGFAVAAELPDFYRPGDGKMIMRKVLEPWPEIPRG
jgi:D-alanine-D-alanine ligase